MSKSSEAPRAVVDTSLCVSGTIVKRGNPYARLATRRSRRFILLLSPRHHRELLTDVCGRPHMVHEYQLTQAELTGLFAGLETASRVEPLPTLPLDVRDPKDRPILGAALRGANDLVTGDNDPLVLAGDSRLGGLQIVTVAAFLAVLDARAYQNEGGWQPGR